MRGSRKGRSCPHLLFTGFGNSESNLTVAQGMQAKPISRRKLIRLGICGLGGAVLGESLLEPNRIESVSLVVPIKDLPEAFEGFKIGVLSDIHWGHAIDSIYMSKACAAVMAFNPDLMVVPGDFLHGIDRHTRERPRLENVIETLNSPNGVLGVLGNHDHWTGASYSRDQIADHSRVELIDGNHRILERKGQTLVVGGVGDMWCDKIDLRKTFQGVDPRTPRILLSHNPDVAEYVVGDWETRVDLQISGHTHGGQYVVPGIYDPTSRVSKYGSKFNHGLVQGRRHSVYVSKGIGRPHGMRFFAPPDVTCLTLTRQV